jgi:hypothetical protein
MHWGSVTRDVCVCVVYWAEREQERCRRKLIRGNLEVSLRCLTRLDFPLVFSLSFSSTEGFPSPSSSSCSLSLVVVLPPYSYLSRPWNPLLLPLFSSFPSLFPPYRTLCLGLRFLSIPRLLPAPAWRPQSAPLGRKTIALCFPPALVLVRRRRNTSLGSGEDVWMRSTSRPTAGENEGESNDEGRSVVVLKKRRKRRELRWENGAQ